jgi:PAS domain S-box-containing protein
VPPTLNSFNIVMSVCLVAAMSYLAAKLGGTLVIRPQMNWALWPGNVLLVSLLLFVQRRLWPLLVVAALVAFVLYDLQEGLPFRSIALLIFSDSVEVLTAALCLSFAFRGTPELNSLNALAKYSFFAVFLAPSLGAFIGAFATKGDYWASWKISFFSEALGFLILVPAIWGWGRKISTWVDKPRTHYLEAIALFAGLALVGYFAFAAPGGSIPAAMLYSPVPFLLWAALRFESLGVGTAVIVVGFLSIWGAVHGRGPFIEPGALKNVFSLQLFLFFTAGPFMVLAALVEERKNAAEALKKSEDKFSKAFRQSPMALTLTSAKDHRYIDVNETFERLIGWSREEVVGRTPFDIGLWVDPDRRRELVKRLLAKGDLQNLELQFRTRTGEVLTGLTSAELIEVNGESCVLSVAADITDMKRAEEARQASERRFAQFFATVPEYCYMVSLSGQILDANPAACQAYGYTKEELIGKPLSTIYAPESHSRMADLFERWKREGTLDNEEMVIITKQGQKRTVLLNVGAVKDAQGNILHTASVQVDISEQKQTQERLRDSEARLEGIIQSAMDAIIAVDEEQRIVVFNSAAEKMFGCPALEAIGTPISRFIPRHFRSVHEARISHFGETGANTGTVGELDALWALRASGEEFPMEASISQVEAGGRKLFTVIIRDITERKRAEGTQRKLAAIVQSSDDAIISVSLDDVITSWNPGAQRMYGYSEAEAVGQPITMIIPPELREEEAEILRRVKAGDSLEHSETVRLGKGANRLDVSLTISPICDSAGKIVGVSKIARNITERKRAEELLYESEERFRLITNAAPVMIWMSGTDKLCTFFNQPWLEFTGRSLQAELGNGWTEGVHPEDFDSCLKTYTTAFDRRDSFQMEYRLRRHDGEYRWVSDLGVPTFKADGSFAGYIGSCVDVTERKLAQEALSGMSRKLIEAQEQERTWIARELHDDFNQRIALLAVNLERLKGDLPASATVVAHGLDEVGEQVSGLGSDIQALSHRLHSSKLEYLGIAAATSSFCREISEMQGVRIDFHSEGVPKRLPQEIALCFFRVLQEAIQNALKHSGSQDLQVWLRGAPNEIELAVSDSGIGFDPEEAITGRGLGLTSMKERLKLVHGELFIESQPQRGTIVRATIPFDVGAKSATA